MPGYVIHLAVAKEYMRNFRIKDEEEFLKGTIAPDLLSKGDKKATHYSKDVSANTDLKKFLKENSISSSYMQGYFLHLIVDYLFYHKYYPNCDTRVYNDYDILNEELIKKYNIEISDEIKEHVKSKTGKLEILDLETIDKLINEISRKKLTEYKKEILKTGIATTDMEENKLSTLKEDKKQKLILAIIIAILCAVMFFFIGQKEGFHCDEIFSYGSSNSAYENVFYSYREKTPMHIFLEEKIFQDGNIFDWIERIKYYFVDHTEEKDKFIAQKMEEEEMIWRTREDAENYLKAKDNRFNYASVYYNQIQDVHPPLFYMLVHTISSIFNNTFSKYIIFAVSLPFFIGTCILIWKILNTIGRKKISILAVVLYGLSIGAISTMMFQRMYMMLTFFSIAYLYINILIIKNDYKINKKHLLALFMISVLGFLTQYFFAIYAILVSCVMTILLIIKKKYKEIFKYIGILIIAAIIGILIFPFSIDHLFNSDRGIKNFNTGNYFENVMTYFNLILRYFGSKWEIALALFAIALLAIIIRRKKERDLMAVLIVPTILYVMVIARITEFLELRYVMNMLPIVAILIIMAVSSIFENKNYNYLIGIAAVIILTGYGLLTEEPLYLYKGYNNYLEIAEKYSEDNLVYVGYTFFNHIQSLPEFTKYKKTFMIYNDQINELENDEELESSNEFILSVNKYMDDEKVLKEVMDVTQYPNYELIYEGCEGVDQVIYRIYR